MKAWLRLLEIRLTSQTLRKTMVFGEKSDINLNIEVEGYKYLSALKDNFTIRISNLTMNELITLIDGKFYDVEIKCGYQSSGLQTIFKGGVLYISNELGDKKTNTVIILCASKLIAQYGQQRMNLSISSGINYWAMFKFICRRAGINDANISDSLRYKFLQESTITSKTIGGSLDTLINSLDLAIHTDESNGGVVSIWNPYEMDKRVVKLDTNSIVFTGSYPRLNSQGTKITVLPTFNFMPGDIVMIDNSIFDISASSKEEVFKNNSIFLDANGEYFVFEVAYHLQNRGHTFYTEMQCKSKSFIKNLGGR